MLHFLKEIYLTTFTIFFRLGVSWTPAYNAGKGVAGIALIEGLSFLAVEGWIEILVGIKFLPHLSKWAVMIAFLVLCAVNHYVLVTRKHGITFEHEFTNLKKSKKVLLLTSSVVTILAAVAFFIYSAVVHRHFIGVDKP